MHTGINKQLTPDDPSKGGGAVEFQVAPANTSGALIALVNSRFATPVPFPQGHLIRGFTFRAFSVFPVLNHYDTSPTGTEAAHRLANFTSWSIFDG
ncbi:hypothetical protein [Roseovarius sp. M141]|uniref:hypothetical protein n=1 Tax=Roseovarius sp. M141 TaxID=2583806 RepID=UPI0020CF9649|nr:hypothetical protein [Roseovarius sp. M141]MCQ0093287.1 hypothetical protein [Roseovarius sp. M141]